MRSPLQNRFKTTAGLLALLAMAVLMSTEASAQSPLGTPLPAPPPLKFVPREERAQLESTRDAKGRLRLSIQLAEARLARAEQLTSGQQFESASRELGFYEGILQDVLRYLKNQSEQSKIRDVYKRFEISLRSHAARLETMRRTTPSEYAVNIRAITEYTRTLRAEALNGFYGDTVIRELPNDDEKTPVEGKNTSTASPKDQP